MFRWAPVEFRLTFFQNGFFRLTAFHFGQLFFRNKCIERSPGRNHTCRYKSVAK